MASDDGSHPVRPDWAVVPDAVFRLDHEGRFTYVNVAAERLLGRHVEELLGQRARDVFPEAVDTLAGWVADGTLRYAEHVTDGIEGAPDAIRQLYAGENTGKRLIYVG